MTFDVLHFFLMLILLVSVGGFLFLYNRLKMKLVEIRSQSSFFNQQIEDKNSKNTLLEVQLKEQKSDYLVTSNNLSSANSKIESLTKINAELLEKFEITSNENRILSNLKTEIETQKKSLEERIKEQQKFIEEAQKNLKDQFENIANKQLADNSKKIIEDSKLNIGNILKPLSDNIENFKKEFAETYQKESRERFALEKEIKRIVEVNDKMTSTTENLTKALKGDRKAQGNWGEMILETLLENAGLKKDIHYRTQESFISEDGSRQLPDVIIKLPDDKDIIVDSKVSLVSYERYFSEENEAEKFIHAKDFITSVKRHIDTLGAKKYQDNDNLTTLDFVIMFMPVEGTFQFAYQYDPHIFSYGHNKGVILASPSTLFPILKAIGSIWKVDSQNKNVQKIIETATQLYDKFINFASSLETVGKNIMKAEESYRDSVSILTSGRGNVVSIVKRLEDFGIDKKRANKKLPEILEDTSEELLQK